MDSLLVDATMASVQATVVRKCEGNMEGILGGPVAPVAWCKIGH